MIEKYTIISILIQFFQRFQTAASHAHLDLIWKKQPCHHLQIHGVVIHHQNGGLRCDKTFMEADVLFIVLGDSPAVKYRCNRQHGKGLINPQHIAAHHGFLPIVQQQDNGVFLRKLFEILSILTILFPADKNMGIFLILRAPLQFGKVTADPEGNAKLFYNMPDTILIPLPDHGIIVFIHINITSRKNILLILHGHDRSLVQYLLRNGKLKFTSGSGNAFHRDKSAHAPHQRLRDSQSQPYAPFFPVPLGIDLTEAGKNLLQILAFYADAGVLHADQQIDPVFFLSALDPHDNAAFFGKLHGIPQQVHYNTAEFLLIAHKITGQAGVTVNDQLQMLSVIHSQSHIDNVGYGRRNIITLLRQHHSAALQLRKVQNIADRRKKITSGSL